MSIAAILEINHVEWEVDCASLLACHSAKFSFSAFFAESFMIIQWFLELIKFLDDKNQ